MEVVTVCYDVHLFVAAMSQNRDTLPSTEVDEPTPKTLKRSRNVPPSTEVDEPTPKTLKRSRNVPPSTEIEEPTPKTTAPENVSHTVSPAN